MKKIIFLLLLIVSVRFFWPVITKSNTYKWFLSVSGKTEVRTVTDGNLKLRVVNKSYEIDPVDIKVYIDDNLAINGSFLIKNNDPMIYEFDLSEGDHVVRAESSKGGAFLETILKVDLFHNLEGELSYWKSIDDNKNYKKFTLEMKQIKVKFK